MPKPLSIATRWQIVTTYNQHNFTNRQLAKQFECSHGTIDNLINLYNQTKNVVPRTRSGRKSQFNRHIKKRLTQALYREPSSTSNELRSYLSRVANINVTSRTIRKQRRNLGFYPVREKIVFQLTKTHKQKRVKFCEKYINSNNHIWGYSDEKIFTIQRTSNRMYIRSNSQIPKRQIRNIKSQFQVWACIWYHNHTELSFIDGNLNSKSYIQVLEQHLLPSMPSTPQFKFIQDNAPSHTAKNTMKWLDEMGVHYINDWPPHSPDLNAIEFVWSWMTNYVNSQSPRTDAELKNAIELAWQNLPQSKIQSFIDHVKNNMQKAIESKGELVT